MALNFNVPKFRGHVPWFMVDLSNKQLLLSHFIPSDMSDTKDIVLTEMPVPGENYQPVFPGGGGNRKLSFTLPLIKRNNTVGNVLLLKQFENLRNQATGFLGVFKPAQFTPNPKVLYYWGTGSIPLEYWVKKCDATHKQGWTNELGMPMYSEISFELWLDESSLLYKAEEVWRKLASLTGMVTQAYDLVASPQSNVRPY